MTSSPPLHEAVGFETRLRQLRNAKNMTQGNLADALGISCGAISQYENGRRLPSYKVLGAMSRLFGKSTDFLLSGSDACNVDEAGEKSIRETIDHAPESDDIPGSANNDLQKRNLNGTIKFCDRLKSLRLSKNISQKDFAKRMGIAPTTISQYEIGNRTPNFPLLRKIASYFQVSTDYLLGVSDTKSHGESENTSKTNIKKQVIRVPVLADMPTVSRSGKQRKIIGCVWKSVSKHGHDDCFAVYAHDSSMAPLISEGDIIILRRPNLRVNNAIYAVKMRGEKWMLRRVKIEEGGVFLIPENHAYAPRFFSKKDMQTLQIHFIGIVIESRKSFMEVGYDDF